MKNSIKFLRKSGAFFFVSMILLNQVTKKEAIRSNGLIQRCGTDARDFLRWFCMDSSFNFPFPFHRIHIILRYRSPYKDVFPFQHQASICCRFGCPENGYEKMCEYHKKLKRCEISRQYHHRTRYSRRRRPCRLNGSRLS